MLHDATLMHDDLQDGDAMRRGRPPSERFMRGGGQSLDQDPWH